jgi:hypothetical protein
MADYYPLITKAVARLDPDAPESRRALYEQARAALLAQLRSIHPPFTEAEITRERLALEEAVRRVEGEAARPARDACVPSFRDRIPTFSDLVADADDLGKAAAEANPPSLNEISDEVPSMIVTGGATGRLTGIWRYVINVRAVNHGFKEKTHVGSQQVAEARMCPA